MQQTYTRKSGEIFILYEPDQTNVNQFEKLSETISDKKHGVSDKKQLVHQFPR